MKTLKLFIIILLIPFHNLVVGQSDSEVLLTIDEREITKKEFLRIYQKNQQNIQSGEQTNVEDYLDLFIHFKLKVIEAENRKLDTLPSIKKELSKYKDELAKPYLIDQKVLDSLMRQAYQRSQKEVRASHILISMPRPAAYPDTLRTYEKINSIRERIIKKDESFNEVARATSDDPSVKSNGGDLGYFSALQMVYSFENRAYNMSNNQISQPFRTRFGYHLLKKTGEREARGKVKVAHIMLIAPPSMTEEKRQEKKDQINQIYHQLKQGAPFEKLAREYSDDKSSAQQGGELPWFGTGRMVPAFEEAAFSLDDKGDYTQPVKTPIGWHIIKLLERKTLGTFTEEKKELKRKIANNPRYQITQDALIEQLKKDYGFTRKKENFYNLYQFIDRDKNQIQWDRLRAHTDNDILFTLEDAQYTTAGFIDFLEDLPRDLDGKYRGQYLLDTAYSRFEDNKIIEYEKQRLPKKYPEYKYILKEYHDGILLFEIMDRHIWSRASEDTTGLKRYHHNHRNQYMWGERFKGKIYLCDDKNTLEKVRKMKKGGLFRKKYSDQELLNELNSEDHQQVKINEGIFLKGENPIIDHHAWNIDSPQNQKEQQRPYLVKGKKLSPQPKSLEEARGSVLADYQNHLEEQWLEQLKEKYSVKVNEQVLEEIKQNQGSK